MSLDPIRIADTCSWFRKAQNDIRAAELLMPEGLLDEVAFHCQQAVEKCLKGFLFWHGKPFKKTHDLLSLIHIFVAAYKPLRIYLFGSHARGTENADSDYDIFIIVDKNVSDELKSASLAYKTLWGIPAAVDVLVWTDQQFQERLHLPNSLPAEIIREGLLLHVA